MGLVFDIETGRIDLAAAGPNSSIIRKDGKKISIPPAEIEKELLEEFQKTRDRTKLDKYKKDYPKLMDGDTILCGKDTSISIRNTYNTGKEKPVDDYKFRASKSVDMLPGGELQVSGIERWDKTDAKTKERHHGELIKNIELKKGFFQVSYSHTDDILVTPLAMIKFIVDGGGFFDVYADALYSAPRASTSIGAGGTEYTNRVTKKSFTAKSDTFEEIIVTGDGIYRRGLTQMDDIFLNQLQLSFLFQRNVHRTMPAIQIDEKTMAEQYKNIPKNMEQALAGVETLKQMSPDDLARLMRMSGQEPPPELMEKLKELPQMFDLMEKRGTMKEMKQAMAAGKGFVEGMGSEGIDRLTRAQKKASDKIKERLEQPVKAVTAEGETVDIESFLKSPRKYKPLTQASGAVKVA